MQLGVIVLSNKTLVKYSNQATQQMDEQEKSIDKKWNVIHVKYYLPFVPYLIIKFDCLLPRFTAPQIKSFKILLPFMKEMYFDELNIIFLPKGKE